MFKQWRGAALDAILLLLIPLVFIDQFDFGVIFSDTILTGGDSASWYQTALHLKDSLLPNGRLFGWDQQNFFGYPNFQYYFIPPFLLVVLLSYVIPLTIALKIVSVAGIFLTPLVTYWALRKLQYVRPVPVAGAWLSLIFLFHERFTMFGGNALSTLAGEFSYSIAFALQIAFLGLLYKGLQSNRYLFTNALLLALIGLSHAFVFLTAIWIPIFYLLSKRGCQQNLKYILSLYLFAFLYMAFWVIPMLGEIAFTTPIKMVWVFPTLNDLLHAVNYEIFMASMLLTAFVLALRLPGRHRWLYLYMLAVSISMFLIATLLKIADIRFFPPFLFFCLLLSIDSLESLVGSIKKFRGVASASLVIASILTSGLWLYDKNLASPDWFRWNNSGYEAKPAFKDGTIASLQQCLEQPAPAPRVAWEKAPYNTVFGSDRVFESLPLLTGRNSTEGIHYASALLSNAITWMHGEYSLSTASPEAILHPHYNFNVVPARFRMFNINEFIAFTPEIKAMVEASPAFQHRCNAGRLSIYELTAGSGGYVETPSFQPTIANLSKDNWHDRYYAWFQHPENIDFPVVAAHFVSSADRELFPVNTVDISARGKMHFLQPSVAPKAKVKVTTLDDFSISFETNLPGAAHIIKVAYSPHWQSTTGETLFPVSPGLMLIYPQQQQVTLQYTRQAPEILGLILTALGIIFTLLLLTRHKRAATSPLMRKLLEMICLLRPVLIPALIVVIVAAALMSYQAKQQIIGDLKRGHAFSQKNDKQAAESAYLATITNDNIQQHPQHPDIPAAMIALARLYVSETRLDDALAQYQQLEQTYPQWRYIHQVFEEQANILRRQGKYLEATRYYQRCAKMDHTSISGKRCQKQVLTEKNNP